MGVPDRDVKISSNMSSTVSTNSKNLELYSIMAEHDGASFPLGYCLLLTASTIHVHKRQNALLAWADCLCDQYGIIPKFGHTNKDMAEIGMLQDTWDMKLQLCWWHMKDCISKRLKGKLATTPYNSERAHVEFLFIDILFHPTGRANVNEHEGGIQDKASITETDPKDRPNGILVCISIFMSLCPSQKAPDGTQHRVPLTGELDTHINTPSATPNIPPLVPHIKLLLPKKTDKNKPVKLPINADFINDKMDDDGKCTFCPAKLHDSVITQVESHLCVHPLIPGYSALTPAGIREWAVKQMYQFYCKYELPEAWAYLWENWYRAGRWEILAHSCNPCIPVLRTTMMLESQ